jgi:ATP-dependent Clp protease ATP-binding subunit ClpC
MEKHTVSKLIGSPPGYVGYEEGGQLTEKVRRKPYSVILFDEIEKAHEDVFNILLQIMEDGRLTDAQGRRVDFKNTIVVMTSNIGARNITEKRTALGFSSGTAGGGRSDEDIRSLVMADLKKTFRPEFINRIDETIVFRQLTKENVREIASHMLKTVADRVKGLGIALSYSEAALDRLAEIGFDPLYGARPLRRTIRSSVEDVIAEKLLDGSLQAGDAAELRASESGLAVEKK